MTIFQIHGIKMLVEKMELKSVGLSALVLYSITGFAFGDHSPLKFAFFVMEIVFFYLAIHGVCWGMKIATSKAYSHLRSKKDYEETE